jgi:TorA maturation chaperone TorD
MSASDKAQGAAGVVAGGGDDTEAVGEISLAEVLAGRATSYRMLSRMFLRPLSESEIADLAAADYISVAQGLEGSGLLAEGFNDMGRALRRRHTGTRQQLSTDFTMCFDGVEAVGGEVASPYASIYLGDEALLNQEPRHKVYRTYRSESVVLDSNIKLPEDHLSFELEFLAILSERAEAALKSSDTDVALHNLELSREFINEHILTWLDLFYGRADKILQTRFYRGVLKATKGYLELDLDMIDDLIEALQNDEY